MCNINIKLKLFSGDILESVSIAGVESESLGKTSKLMIVIIPDDTHTFLALPGLSN